MLHAFGRSDLQTGTVILNLGKTVHSGYLVSDGAGVFSGPKALIQSTITLIMCCVLGRTGRSFGMRIWSPLSFIPDCLPKAKLCA